MKDRINVKGGSSTSRKPVKEFGFLRTARPKIYAGITPHSPEKYGSKVIYLCMRQDIHTRSHS
jgi:hypothetical protein